MSGRTLRDAVIDKNWRLVKSLEMDWCARDSLRWNDYAWPKPISELIIESGRHDVFDWMMQAPVEFTHDRLLEAAIKRNDVHMVQGLLAKGASIITAMNMVAKQGHVGMMQALLASEHISPNVFRRINMYEWSVDMSYVVVEYLHRHNQLSPATGMYGWLEKVCEHALAVVSTSESAQFVIRVLMPLHTPQSMEELMRWVVLWTGATTALNVCCEYIRANPTTFTPKVTHDLLVDMLLRAVEYKQTANALFLVTAMRRANVSDEDIDHSIRRCLASCIFRGSLDTCLGLIQHMGWDINALDRFGLTLLHNAVVGHSDNKDYSMVNRLLKEPHIDVNARTATDGFSPLMLATRSNWRDYITPLLQAGADLEAVDNMGHTALMHAFRNTHVDVITRLLQAGANPAVVAVDGTTCLQLMVQARSSSALTHVLADERLRASDHIHRRDNSGRSLLMLVTCTREVWSSSKQWLAALLAAGVDVNAVDKDGRSALVYALERNNKSKLARMLLAAGANVDIGVGGGESGVSGVESSVEGVESSVEGGESSVSEIESGVRGVESGVEEVKKCVKSDFGERKSNGDGVMAPLLTAAKSGFEDVFNMMVAATTQPNVKHGSMSVVGAIMASSAKADARENMITQWLLAGGIITGADVAVVHKPFDGLLRQLMVAKVWLLPVQERQLVVASILA